MSLFICSPAYNMTFVSGYVESLANSIKDLHDHDIRTLYKTVDGMHWIDMARDVMAHIFLHTNCSHMLQIDADLGWDADAPRKMMAEDKDIIGGAYRVKTDLVDTYTAREKNGIVEGLGGGFLMIKREVIEKMTELYEPYAVSTLQYGRLTVAPLFRREFHDGSFTGEDFMFCRRAVAAGYKLNLFKDINFSHYGINAWEGNYSKAN